MTAKGVVAFTSDQESPPSVTVLEVSCVLSSVVFAVRWVLLFSILQMRTLRLRRFKRINELQLVAPALVSGSHNHPPSGPVWPSILVKSSGVPNTCLSEWPSFPRLPPHASHVYQSDPHSFPLLSPSSGP